MHVIDLLLVGLYLVAVVTLGARVSRGQRGLRDYFLTTGHVPWWALLGSIVATETSTVTLISIPGYAFGGDLTFLQLAFGYVIARVFVAVLLVPRLFHQRLLTAYQLLATRFGPVGQRVTAALFLGTRSLSDGFRLFATGLVVAAVFETMPMAVAAAHLLSPGGDPGPVLLVGAIIVIAVATLGYTLLGGMTAVVWTDVIQLGVYLGGTVALGVILLGAIPGGWAEVIAAAGPAGKLRVIDLTLDLSRSYTFWSGLVGGIFITAATHGADQMFVQRYLCCRSVADAQRALIVSGIVVCIQFAMFLVIGVMLWVYYTGHATDALAAISAHGQVQTDRILPAFMMSHLPVGLRGIMVAAIVAAAMSTLSSSLNSSAASTMGDFRLSTGSDGSSDRQTLRLARRATVGWAVVQTIVALGAILVSSRVVDEVLGIQSFTGGLMLGALTLALLTRARTPAVLITALLAGAAVLAALRLGTDVSWQWYALVGSLTTLIVGAAADRARRHLDRRETAR